MKRYAKHQMYAVDIAYKNLKSGDGRIHKYHFFEEIPQKSIDYAIMMDSLEYMERDAAYVKKVSRKIKSGGYFFFTLPAFPILFSDYDINIKNLRRYNRKSFAAILKEIPELEIIEEYYFYTSLFLIRFIQKLLHIPIDPNHKFTANRGYGEDTWITRLLTACLNLDFSINKVLGKLGIYFPGLSMIAICRKKWKIYKSKEQENEETVFTGFGSIGYRLRMYGTVPRLRSCAGEKGSHTADQTGL